MMNASCAAAIRAEIARRQIRQRELAERIGRSQAWLSRKVTGVSPLTLDDIQLLAKGLEVPVDALLAREPV